MVNAVLTPVFVQSEGKYKAGIWVRDSTAGIGTITFFNPSSGKLAALGHPITDVDTGEIIPILNGQAVETAVTSVTKSSAKETGSVCCDFSNKVIGTLRITRITGFTANIRIRLIFQNAVNTALHCRRRCKKDFAKSSPRWMKTALWFIRRRFLGFITRAAKRI